MRRVRLVSIVRVLLYYTRVIDSSIVTAVNMLSEQQFAPTKDSNMAIQRLIDYCRLYSNDYLVFIASDVVLHIKSDAIYQSRLYARSVAGGLFYLGNRGKPTAINNPLDVLLWLNVPKTRSFWCLGVVFMLCYRSVIHNLSKNSFSLRSYSILKGHCN